MNVEQLKMSREKARELWRLYEAHRDGHTVQDTQIAAIYKRLAQGHTVIRAIESIRAAGADEKGHPRLAIARADEIQICCRFSDDLWTFGPDMRYARSPSRVFQVPFDGAKWQTRRVMASVPLIPVHLRPRRGIQNYHILWEADWTAYPRDPYLLRRFGEDAWLVVAAWDLTEVERAVMSQRVSA